MSSSYAEQSENKSSAQKQKASVKKKILKIKHGEVYPGDAAVAGYIEDDASVFGGTRRYVIKEKSETYIFSEVEGPRPGDTFGYFRVLWHFAYGKEEKNGRDHLTYAVLTGIPACLNPQKKDCGTPSLKKVGSLIILYQGGFGDYKISIYEKNELRTLHLGRKDPNFSDLDGDGYFETIGYEPISIRIAEYKSVEGERQANVLVIYRYNNGFSRIKGKSFEKYYMEHAQELIEKKYPEWLDKLNRTKEASFDRELKRRTVYSIIAAWLATIENTQNPELIKETLKKLKELPYPSEEEKQAIVKKLVQYGYTGLKIE